MDIRPDFPRALAVLLSGGFAVNPVSQNPTIVEVVGIVQTAASFPIALPRLIFVAVVVGGQMGQMYSSKVQVRNPAGQIIAAKSTSELPFTSTIKRCNIAQGLLDITTEPVVTEAGLYRVELLVRDELLGHTPLEIQKVIVPAAPPA